MRLEKLKARLALYYEAERAILTSQAYTVGDRTLTRADLKTVRAIIDDLEDTIDSLENSRGLRREVVF